MNTHRARHSLSLHALLTDLAPHAALREGVEFSFPDHAHLGTRIGRYGLGVVLYKQYVIYIITVINRLLLKF